MGILYLYGNLQSGTKETRLKLLDHLDLVPFSPKDILALIDSEQQFGLSFGISPAEGLREMFISDEVSPEWIAQLHNSTSADPFRHGFALIHKADNLVIGSLGFTGPPDQDGIVEIAYGIAPAYQNRGFATEAAKAGVEFALSRDTVTKVIAHTLPSFNASAHVLTKCGFEQVGEIEHPEDGLIWRWEKQGKVKR